MRLKHKSWAKPFLDAHPEIILTKEHLTEGLPEELMKVAVRGLEIGAGRGDFIVNLASRYEKMAFLAVEMNVDALAVCAKKIVNAGLKNVKIIYADIQSLLDSIPSHQFAYIFLNFSDPWPKKRHEKRRLTFPKMLENYEKLLGKDGQVILKTDNKPLFDYSLEKLVEQKWQVSNINYDYQGDEPFDASSEYEQKFRAQGVKINRLMAQKE